VAQFVADPGPGKRLIGHAGGTVLPEEPGVTVVFAVYLTPARRGGPVLAEMVDAVAAWSRASGRDELMLEVVVGNDRAVRAYQRLGFVETGVRVPHPVLPALTELQMRRPA
jgi:RimJ/RimL family protein N-acetyltransferase